MGAKDPRVDAYIQKSADFAKPILGHIREVVHDACPECVETLKWSAPHFDYKGIMCGMVAFKRHCTFGFWKSSLVFEGGRESELATRLGHLESESDLPSDAVLKKYVRKAMKLNDEGVKSPEMTARGKTTKPELPVPSYFTAALSKNRKANETFRNFSPSCRREYIEWITEAKTDTTREKRMQIAIEWMAEGKQRNWKYQR